MFQGSSFNSACFRCRDAVQVFRVAHIVDQDGDIGLAELYGRGTDMVATKMMGQPWIVDGEATMIEFHIFDSGSYASYSATSRPEQYGRAGQRVPLVFERILAGENNNGEYVGAFHAVISSVVSHTIPSVARPEMTVTEDIMQRAHDGGILNVHCGYDDVRSQSKKRVE